MLLISTALLEYYKSIDKNHGEEVSLAMHTNLVSSRALFEFFIGTVNNTNGPHNTDFGISQPSTKSPALVGGFFVVNSLYRRYPTHFLSAALLTRMRLLVK